MAYHWKMKVPQEEKARKKNHCYNQLAPAQCIVVGFKKTTSNLTGLSVIFDWEAKYRNYLWKPLPGMKQECFSDEDCNGEPEDPNAIGQGPGSGPGTFICPGQKVQEWFSADCCPKEQSGGGGSGCGFDQICNASITPPPGQPLFQPNCPVTSAPGGSILYENPILQSSNFPRFKCKPFMISVCRPIGFPNIPRYEDKDSLLTDYTKASAPPYPPGIDHRTHYVKFRVNNN